MSRSRCRSTARLLRTDSVPCGSERCTAMGSPLRRTRACASSLRTAPSSPPYELRWKVLNTGPQAESRDIIRGQIISSSEGRVRIEHSDFQGEHVVECYVVKDGVVVARDRIDVPISYTTRLGAVD